MKKILERGPIADGKMDSQRKNKESLMEKESSKVIIDTEYREALEEQERIERKSQRLKNEILKDKEQETRIEGFEDYATDEGGRIELSEKDNEMVAKDIENIKKRFRFSPPSIAAGFKTATEYDSKAANFSTRTTILELPDGKKVFSVYNYPMSGIHRFLDGFSKRMSGNKFKKASHDDWKRVFEARSNVPVIANDDPNMVLMPYIPNMNSYDLFTRNKEIDDCGPCPWAKDLDLNGKVKLGEDIIKELEEVHNSGRSWGETILPNIIISSDKKPIIVDPETQYFDDIQFVEQTASDLRDIVYSISGALHKGENIKDYNEVVNRLLDSYKNKEVIEKLKELVLRKPTLIQKIFKKTYEVARLGIDYKEGVKVKEEILKYIVKK